MAKLRLQLPENLGDVLTTEEMKKVLGGTGSGSLSGSENWGSTNAGSSCSISTVCPDKKTSISCSGNYSCVKTIIYGKEAVRCDQQSVAICP